MLGTMSGQSMSLEGGLSSLGSSKQPPFGPKACLLKAGYLALECLNKNISNYHIVSNYDEIITKLFGK